MTDRGRRFQDRILSGAAAWVPEIQAIAAAAEQRRPLAAYDTGTVSVAAAVYLRALTAYLNPARAVEIGTFIGTSTLAIIAGHVCTCDKSNDCLPSSDQVTCFPKTRSAQMLAMLADQSVKADFFFLDGRLEVADLCPLIEVATERAVFAFDDYEGHEKGVINVGRLEPWLHPKRGYELIEPPAAIPGIAGLTTIALLVPGALL